MKTTKKTYNQNLSTYPELVEHIPHTPKTQIDKSLSELQVNKKKWLSVTPGDRIVFLDKINQNLLHVSDRWIHASMRNKGIPSKSFAEGEEWMILAKAFRTIRLLRRTLQDILKFGHPRLPSPVSKMGDRQWCATVFPFNLMDRLLFQKISGEIWLEPGIDWDEIFNKQAYSYKDPKQQGSICLVLAAGNVSDLSIVDPLYKLFVENQVVIYKSNPVNAYLGLLLEKCFSTLIENGYVRIVYGTNEEGAYLCYHKLVDEIHLTGSDKTYEAIVFGPGENGNKRKLNQKPLLKKRFTAELGNVTPLLIVPGPWSDKDITMQAVNIVSNLVYNAGFNCLTPRILIQYKNWELRQKLIDRIVQVLEQLPTRKAYYPGAQERFQSFLAAHPDAIQIGERKNDHLPWTIIPDVDPNNKEDICFTQESFCCFFAETALETSDSTEYIHKAVDFANHSLWGSLTCSILVHPRSLRDPQIATAIDQAIEKLNYGSIAVNLRTEFPYYLVETPWGAFPGHSQFDIQSGTGKVGNLFMFDRPQKSVIRGPFKMRPNPFVVTYKHFHQFAKQMVYYESSPSVVKLPKIIWSAIKG